MKFSQPESLPEKIASHIGERIIRIELAPSSFLREESISKSLEVSRGPVREAFQILARQRLVDLVPRRGARVTELTSEFIESLYDILVALWPIAARKAMANAGGRERYAIQEALFRMQEHAMKGKWQEYFESQFHFGSIALMAARDPLLSQTLADFLPSNRRVQFLLLSSGDRGLQSQITFFVRIHDSVMAGDSDNLARAVREFGENEKAFAMRLCASQNPQI